MVKRTIQHGRVTDSISFCDSGCNATSAMLKENFEILENDVLITVRIPKADLEKFDRMRREIHDNCSRSAMIREIVHYYCMAEEVLDAAEKREV